MLTYVTLLAAVARAAATLPPPSKIVVTNLCATQPMWISNQVGDSYMCPQMSKLTSKDTPLVFEAPRSGIPSMILWAQAGCNDNTGLCQYGMSSWNAASGFQRPPSSPSNWAVMGNQPAINTKFEITFGCQFADDPYQKAQCANNPSSKGGSEKLPSVDSWDISGVDGVTPMPVTLDVVGGECGTSPRSITTANVKWDDICRDFKYVQKSTGKGYTLDLRVKDFFGTVIGCANPCKRLTATDTSNWFMPVVPTGLNLPLAADHEDAQFYCCTGAASGSDNCTRGFIVGGLPIAPFTTEKYYTELASQHIYSQPYSDNKHEVSPVAFTCDTGSVTYNVAFHCPLHMTAPPTPVAPSTAWVGPEYAEFHYLDLYPSPRNCQFNPQGTSGQAICTPGGALEDCGDCRAYAQGNDIHSDGTYSCQCPTTSPMRPVQNPPHPLWQNQDMVARCSKPTPPPETLTPDTLSPLVVEEKLLWYPKWLRGGRCVALSEDVVPSWAACLAKPSQDACCRTFFWWKLDSCLDTTV